MLVAIPTVDNRASAIVISPVPAIGKKRYRPMRLMIRPLAIDVTSTPPIIGVNVIPAPVGLTPFTTCRYSGMKVTEPNSAKPTMKPTAQAIAKHRLAKSRSGSIGSATRRSTAMNASNDASAAAARPIAAGRGPVKCVAAKTGEQDDRGQHCGEQQRAGQVDRAACRRTVGGLNAQPMTASATSPSGRLT